MSKKRYTSEEMREMAIRFGRLMTNPDCLTVCSPAKCGWACSASNAQKVQDMLLQAADLEEEPMRSIDDTRAALVERDALKAQLAESDEKWASRVELQKRCTETVEKELNQANSRLSSVIKECERQTIAGYQPKSELSQLVMRSENATFAKIKAIAKGEIK